MIRPRYWILGLILILAAAAIGGVLWDFRRFLATPLPLEGGEMRYGVVPGASLRTVAGQLAKRSVLRRPLYFVLLGYWQGSAHRIRAGEYDFAPGTTPAALLKQLVEGSVVQHSLTLVEGWTFQQVREAVRKHEALHHTLDGFSQEKIMGRIGHPGEHPEGRFCPDTYHFPHGTTDAAFLSRAYDKMQASLVREWDKRKRGLPYKNTYEALIVASIVEKETAVSEERASIAGVFVRRLYLGMPLQTDPTVIYGLGAAFDGDLRRRDHLRADTPYNTYIHPGLPPTPIAMPGAASLHAALHPADGKALYFVARGDGSHHFSDTLEEHNRAMARYQLKRHAP
jgi:conserved hypothetical protein, YceG family